MHRLLLSILFVLAGSFIYENMNIALTFKGIIADNNNEITEQPEPQVSSIVKMNDPVALDKKYAFSDALARIESVNQATSNHLFIGENYKNIKFHPDSLKTEETVQGDEQHLSHSDESDNSVHDHGGKQTVYLTFDDGPNQFSEQLLALLEAYEAKATFFLIDKNIRLYPEAVNQMVADGHSLGLHSVTHDVKTFYQSASSVISEMDQVRETVKEVTGVETMLIRTPYGSVPHMKDSYVKAVYEHGYVMWDWNIDSKDWYYRDRRYVEACIAQLEAFGKRKEPIVILLHEREETLAHLPALLDYLKKENYVMKAIDSSMAPVAFK